jgi:hypothetical protein
MSSVTSERFDAAFPAERGIALRATLLLLVGLVAGALVLLAFTVSFITGRLLGLVLAAFLLLDGVAALRDGASASNRREVRRWSVVDALVSIGAGLLIVLVIRQTPMILGGWAILTGLLQARIAYAPTGRGFARVAAAASVAVGLLILVGPFPDPVRQILVFAVYGVIVGGLRVGAALRTTKLRSPRAREA